jgi:putative nucleotidyltransferase with HDIG domain
MDGRELELYAQDTARHLLAPLENRWWHTAAVARRTRAVAEQRGLAGPHLVVAGAWLHDIGYSPTLRDTGFHPVDGARYLAEQGWPPAVVGLVAHHSGARYVAAVRGALPDLAEWAFEDSTAMDILTFADQTTGPTGHVVDLEDRMLDMLRRRGADSPSALAHPVRSVYLRAVRCRIEPPRERLVTLAAR